MKGSLWNSEALLKERFRAIYKEKRLSLSPERRQEAAKRCLTLKIDGLILSFSSLPGEIDTSLLNERLASEGRLLLPRCEGDYLHVYRVDCPKTQLISGSFGLLEPDPSQCQKIAPYSIGCILVPGLAFDQSFHRLGYGKGHYDRFLALCPPDVPTYGLGFIEQRVNSLPVAPHDIPLTALYLF